LVTLGNDELKCIALFEQLTGAAADDCVIEPDRIIFVVKEGQMGRAIGKGGSTINKVREMFKKQIDVAEDAETVEAFIRGMFPGVQLRSISMKEGEGAKKFAQITVDSKDRGAVIGRGGSRIKLARTLVERRFGAELKLI